jgi:tetrapyrrole methylase family protein/MazG family protein
MTILKPGQLLDLAASTFGLDLSGGAQLWEAGSLLAAARPAGLPAADATPEVRSWAETTGAGAYVPPAAPFPLAPTAPALIYAAPGADWIALAALLATRYPASHPIRLATVDAQGTASTAQDVGLETFPALTALRSPCCMLYLPALPIASALRGPEGLAWVVARLLGPGGCPWDVRQSHQSLRPALLEEAHEVLEALDAGDMAALSEELGDLLLSVVVHSEMARQAGHFALDDVLEQIAAKLVRRHPHVFGDLAVEGEGAVLANWEQIKAAELAAKGKARESALDGVPPSLPALAAAQKLGKKAARAGFNWREIDHIWMKLREELDELAEAAAAGDQAHAGEELGDLLFVLTRLADWLGLDAETALREANGKFRRRFTGLVALAAAEGSSLRELTLEQMVPLWNQVKRETGSRGGA